ncbi:MAG: methyltransferase domain-containing protein [Cyanobacteria bacterium]|jgi:SAM-dependent methyltransferase|nr:methyltransferase domain-containing protein [Cyanobacteria bacterium GSL.Bin1]
MKLAEKHLNYDKFAWFYNQYWGKKYCDSAFPCIEQLLLPYLSEQAKVLDLCCGTGQIMQNVIAKGFRVTGLDISKDMLEFAKQNAPSGNFVIDDARSFSFSSTFQAVYSTHSSLNHILHLNELTSVFKNVYTALVENGIFVFDMPSEERYQSEILTGKVTDGDVKKDYAYAVGGQYDSEQKTGYINITIFDLISDNSWQRSDINWLVRCYSEQEIKSTLEKVGFTKIDVYDGGKDLG